MLAQRRSVNLLSTCRRHFSAATPATSSTAAADAKKKKQKNAPTRYMPPTANGRFLIEQLNEHWSSAVAAVDFQAGNVIGTAPGIFHSRPTRFTIQVDTHKHLEFAGGLEYVNHSCEPNARLVVSENTPEVAFVATRDIKEGEHLSFDYTTSEWDMDEKFDCRCGSKECRGHIGGAKYLKDSDIASSLPLFTPPILRLLLERKITQ
ncbi:Zinc-binding region-containing protein, partial [Globisporangium splendens]